MAQPLLADPSFPDPIALSSAGAEEPISLAAPLSAPAPSQEVATRRASKTQQGLGSVLGTTQEELQTRFIQGQEDNIRKQAALTMDYRNRLKGQEDLKYLLGSSEGTLDPQTIYNVTHKKPVDPSTVIEKAYTDTTLSSLNTAASSLGGTTWTDSLVGIPAQVAQTVERGSDFGTKREFLQTWLENAEQAKGKQSWPGRIADEAKGLTQLYPEAKIRGNFGVSIFSSLGLGSTIEDQADYIFTKLDNDKFKQIVAPVLDKFIKDNPSAAADYIHKLLGQSDKERVLGNIFTTLALPDLYAGGKILTNLGKKTFQYNEVQKAVRDVLAEGRKPNATPADIQAAAGDLAGSAVKDVSKIVEQTADGTLDASRITGQAMTENFTTDIAKIVEGTPRNREVATRIQETLAGATNPIEPTIRAMNKVNRTPLSLGSEENLNAVKNAIKEDYRGPWNSLLNVFIDKESWNKFTNTWDYKLHIGNMNGEYFSNKNTAINFAKDNGFGNARVVSGTGNIESEGYASAINAINKAKAQRTEYQKMVSAQQAIVKDVKSTAEQKTAARKEASSIQKAGVEAKNKEINQLEASLNVAPNTKRLAEIRIQLDNLKKEAALHAASASTPEVKAEIKRQIGVRTKDLQQEMRALNYGVASPINRDPVIRQQGVGYYLELTRPLNETMPVVRDLMIKDLQEQFRKEAISSAISGISSWKNALIGKYRSPEDTLSKIENTERKAAVYSQAVLERLGDNLGKYIEDVARGKRRFDDLGNPIPWYFSVPRYVAGIPYKFAKNVAGEVFNPELGIKSTVNSTRRQFQEWERVVDYARRNKDPNGVTGWFFQNQGQLEDYYLRTFQRMPSYSESLAYFAKVELDEYNRVLTNIAVYRNKARLGTMSHQIIMTDGTARTASTAFDGVQRKEFPGGSGNIFVMDNSSGKPSKVFSLEGNNIPNQLREQWKQMVSNGKLKVVEIWDPEMRPLNGFGNVELQRVRYVLTDALDSQPIAYNQVNRRGGGHFDYEYDHYLKQAVIRNEQVGNRFTAHYEGDTSVMALPNRIMGKDIGDNLDVVRQLIKDGRIDEARDYTKAKLMMEFDGTDGVHSWFKPGRDHEGKVTAPRLNLDEKFHVVPRGKSIIQLDDSLEKRIGETGYHFQDGTTSGSLARQFQVAYTKERDAYNLIAPDNVGTAVRPLYKYEPAKLVDAMPTMQRALNRAIKSTFMDDYKIFATEHWLREAEPYLKEGAEAARSSPFYHFNNPVYRSGTPREIEKNLEYNRYKIQQFTGIPSEFDTTIHAYTQKLVDAAYEAGVSNKLLDNPELKGIRSVKDTAIVPIWLLNRIHDPVTKIRSLTYNFKLGLFNLPQLLVQAQTHASIWAIAGRNGGAGTYAGMLHTWSRFGDDAFLKTLDNYATKIGFAGVKWKPGEFYEARKLLETTGFEHVAGEYAVLDDAFGHKFVGNDFNSFLSLGQQFFKEGERWTRYSAWYTAFKEFRAKNPIGAITKEDTAAILQRADLLTTNMSRASSSALHTGVLGLSTQFLSYQLRLAELFVGKRLGETVKDRAIARMRLFGVYSGLYGVPAAFGLSGLSVSNAFRAEAINQGYYPGQSFIDSLFMEGVPSMLTALITGEGDYKKGQFYNFGDRYGAQGFTQIREALWSDNPWWKILGGAGVTTVANTFINSHGLAKAMVSFARGDSADTRFKFTLDDVVDAGKEIASVNAGWRLITALNTGKWYSKNESNIMPVSDKNAIWMTLTGLSTQEQDDIYVKNNIIKSQEAVNKYALTKFIQEVHRSVASKEQNNPEQAHDYLRRGFAYLEAAGYPTEKKLTAISIALKGWETRVDKTDWNFYLKNTPADQTAQRLKTYKDIQKLNDYRKKP